MAQGTWLRAQGEKPFFTSKKLIYFQRTMGKESPVLSKRIETERLLIRSCRPGDGPMYYRAGVRNREHLREFESGNVLMLDKERDL